MGEKETNAEENGVKTKWKRQKKIYTQNNDQNKYYGKYKAQTARQGYQKRKGVFIYPLFVH